MTTIRVATKADISEMHRVRLSVRENQLSHPSRVQPDHYEEMLTTRGRGWVADAGGRIRGFAVVDLQEHDVWALFVEPESEGAGIGSQLQDVMLDWAFGAGAEQLSLTTSANTRAERFYTTAGWQRVGMRLAATYDLRCRVTAGFLTRCAGQPRDDHGCEPQS